MTTWLRLRADDMSVAAMSLSRRRLVILVGLLAGVWAAGLDQTKSAAGWCTALLLVGAGFLCWALWCARCPGPPWLLCSLGFVVLASDDYFFGAHDDVRAWLRELTATGLGKVGALVVAATALVGVAVLAVRWFVRRLPRATAFQAGVGFAVAILGAGVVDVMGGRITRWTSADSELHRLSVVVEESLELLGVALVFLALAELLSMGHAAESPDRRGLHHRG